ncbi:MAG: hypothetical protein V1740_02750 [Candidatus Woesearchaeota archaeon]
MGLFGRKKNKELPPLDLPPPPKPIRKGDSIGLKSLPPLPRLTPPPLPDLTPRKKTSFLQSFKGKEKREIELPPLPELEPNKGRLQLPEMQPLPDLNLKKIGERKKEMYPDLPPLPKLEPITKGIKSNRGMPELPPLPEIPQFEEKRLPQLPKLDIHAKERRFGLGKLQKPEGLKHFEHPAPLEQMPEPIMEKRKFEDMGPLFVKTDDYKEIMKNIRDVRTKINESDQILLNLNEIKNQKEKEFDKIHNQLEDIQRKLVYIDKAVFGG